MRRFGQFRQPHEKPLESNDGGPVAFIALFAEECHFADVVTEAGEALVTELSDIEDALIQKRTVDGQTVINFPSRLNHHFIYLRGAVDGSEVGLIEGAQARLADLMLQWDVQRSALNELLGPKLANFNALVVEQGIPMVEAKP